MQGKTLIIERDVRLGGILNQCIHNGFGLHYFKEELTGPEYADRFVQLLKDTNVDVMLNTFVTKISGKKIAIVSPNGAEVIELFNEPLSVVAGSYTMVIFEPVTSTATSLTPGIE